MLEGLTLRGHSESSARILLEISPTPPSTEAFPVFNYLIGTFDCHPVITNELILNQP
jgi:hypothetical protein